MRLGVRGVVGACLRLAFACAAVLGGLGPLGIGASG